MIAWTDEARADIAGFTAWLHERNPYAAKRVAEDVFACIENLARFPMSGREGRRAGTRELVIGRRPYLVVYRVEQLRIVVLRVLHGARSWSPDTDVP